MGDGAFQLLLSAPHRRATPASAAAARTEDGVQRRDIDRKDPRGPGGLAVLWRRPSQSVGPVAHGGGSDLEGPRASVDARSAVARAVAHAAEGRESAHGNDHHRAAQQSLGQRPHCDGHGRGWTGDGVRGGRSLHDGMRGPSRGQESHAVRGPGAAPAGVRDYCGGFRAGAAAGIRNRHDHGSQYMSDDYQAEIAFLGMQSSPSFVRQPECNGCVERFIRTLKEQFLWVRTFQSVEELRHGLAEFRERYNQRWIVQRWGYLTPAQARHSKSVLWKSPRSRGKSHAALARLVICLICSPTSSPVYLSSISSSASRRCWLFVSSSSRILANLTLDQKGRYRVSVGGSASVDFLFELVKASDY